MKRKTKIKPNLQLISDFEIDKENYDKDYDLDYVNRKKELILLEYQSIFDVYGREFTIVYSFRGWAIGLLTAYFGFLFTINLPKENWIINSTGLFIIIAFYILEVAERSVMRRMLKEVRYVDSIFMKQSPKEFKNEVTKYVFRDIRDAKRTLREKIVDFLISTVHLQVVVWNLFLLTAYFILTYILPLIHNNPSNPITK